jgi:hypothetical protein
MMIRVARITMRVAMQSEQYSQELPDKEHGEEKGSDRKPLI